MTGTERVQTVVVGGGQSGLSVGYHLARRGLPFLILDAHEGWRRLAAALGHAPIVHAGAV